MQAAQCGQQRWFGVYIHDSTAERCNAPPRWVQEGGGLVDTEAVVACTEEHLGYSPHIVHLAANSLASAWHDVSQIAHALHAGALRLDLLVGSDSRPKCMP